MPVDHAETAAQPRWPYIRQPCSLLKSRTARHSMAGSGAVSRPPHGALESILRCCITTEEIMQKNGWLIGWVCFVGFVTWLDWWGAIPYIFVSFGVGFSRIMFFLIPILLL